MRRQLCELESGDVGTKYLCGCLAVTGAVFALAGCGGERDPKDFLQLEKGMREDEVMVRVGEPDSIVTKE